MAQTPAGALKIAASKAGVSVAEYQHRVRSGLKWCYRCRDWRPVAAFGVDASRFDGRSAICLADKRVVVRVAHVGGPPDRATAQRAVDAVRYAVRMGRLPPIRTLLCCRCSAPAKHYHHHMGYTPTALLAVIPLCIGCHQRAHHG